MTTHNDPHPWPFVRPNEKNLSLVIENEAADNGFGELFVHEMYDSTIIHSMALTNKQKEVLLKVVHLLTTNKISYQVTGGTAAIMWGVERETEDLDFDVAERDMKRAGELFREWIVEGYHHYQGDDLELWLIIAGVDGVQVEFGQAEGAKILGIGNNTWTQLPNTISNTTTMVVDGVPIRVQSKKDLIEYKKILGREVDKVDVAALRLFE
jgi:hypothetical protein